MRLAGTNCCGGIAGLPRHRVPSRSGARRPGFCRRRASRTPSGAGPGPGCVVCIRPETRRFCFGAVLGLPSSGSHTEAGDTAGPRRGQGGVSQSPREVLGAQGRHPALRTARGSAWVFLLGRAWVWAWGARAGWGLNGSDFPAGGHGLSHQPAQRVGDPESCPQSDGRRRQVRAATHTLGAPALRREAMEGLSEHQAQRRSAERRRPLRLAASVTATGPPRPQWSPEPGARGRQMRARARWAEPSSRDCFPTDDPLLGGRCRWQPTPHVCTLRSGEEKGLLGLLR